MNEQLKQSGLRILRSLFLLTSGIAGKSFVHYTE